MTPWSSGSRRATLVGGPDVWEVIRALRSARSAEPTLAEPELLDLVADNTGVAPRLLRVAVGYWAAYPDEVTHSSTMRPARTTPIGPPPNGPAACWPGDTGQAAARRAAVPEDR